MLAHGSKEVDGRQFCYFQFKPGGKKHLYKPGNSRDKKEARTAAQKDGLDIMRGDRQNG